MNFKVYRIARLAVLIAELGLSVECDGVLPPEIYGLPFKLLGPDATFLLLSFIVDDLLIE